jgi:hypothetical protein
MHAGRPRQRRFGVARDGDDGDAQPGRVRDEQQHFGSFAGIRQRQQDVVARDHADVTVTGFGGMHEERGSAGGGQRRGDLAPHVAGLAHATDDDATSAFQAEVTGPREAGIQPGHQGGDGLTLDFQRAPPGGDQQGGIGRGRAIFCRRIHDWMITP